MSELLFELLDRGSKLIWPKKKAQELLFDLGERKSYTPEQRLESIKECALWWVRCGVEPKNSMQCEQLSWKEIRPYLQLSDKTPSPGVAKGLGDLSKLSGIASKTLANHLSEWYRCDRTEHRWLLFLGRTLQTDECFNGYIFHRRSIFSLNLALERSHGHLEVEQLDAVDAMLLLGLVSYWQRRRLTEDVRANRRQPRPRTETPKPIVGLSGTLLQPGLLEVNISYIEKLRSASSLRLLFELALSEAHLVPHSQRASSHAYSIRSLGWLETLEESLKREEIGALLGEDAGYFLYRIEVMKAYRDKRPPSKPPEALREHPYISSVWHLSQIYWEKANGRDLEGSLLALRKLQRVDDWEGKPMQISQINSKMKGVQK